MYELTISSETDASSGLYDTDAEVLAALEAAAEVDGLTVRVDSLRAGRLVDADGVAWFSFKVRKA